MENDAKFDHVVEEIDGKQYLIQCMSPSQTYKMGIELTKIIGDPFTTAAKAASTAKNDDELSGMISVAVKALLGNIDPDRSLEMIKTMLGSVEFRGKGASTAIGGKNFDLHFHGQNGHMLRVVGKVMVFQFKDFFESLLDAVRGVMDQAAQLQKKGEEAA